MDLNRETAMRLWSKSFGKETKVKDFAGRVIAKGAYDDRNSEFGWNVDHIFPQSKGGKTADYNLVCCHIRTNDEKADNHVIDAFRKKMKKVNQYHKQFQHMGLAIIIDIPLFFFYDPEWGKWLVEINEGQYDFVALIHWSGVDIYDFLTGNYLTKGINREDMDALQKIGRMAAEGIIKDDDPVWR